MGSFVRSHARTLSWIVASADAVLSFTAAPAAFASANDGCGNYCANGDGSPSGNGNGGIAKTNPAHTGCTPTTPPSS
jgi:hypothetical protein